MKIKALILELVKVNEAYDRLTARRAKAGEKYQGLRRELRDAAEELLDGESYTKVLIGKQLFNIRDDGVVTELDFTKL